MAGVSLALAIPTGLDSRSLAHLPLTPQPLTAQHSHGLVSVLETQVRHNKEPQTQVSATHACSLPVCKFKAHKRCAVRATSDCKWTTLASIGKDIIEDEDGVRPGDPLRPLSCWAEARWLPPGRSSLPPGEGGQGSLCAGPPGIRAPLSPVQSLGVVGAWRGEQRCG